MATPDFSKVWASSSPLPAYTFSDADYITGWDFVGSAPPTKNEFDAWFKLVDEKLNYLYSQLQDTASKLYPVGSVYISFNSANPSTLFGGTWTRLKDTFLLASGDSYAPGSSGGNSQVTLTENQIPAHKHTVNSAGSHTHTATTSNSGSHTHTRGSMNITGRVGCLAEEGTNYPNGAFYQTSTKGTGHGNGLDYMVHMDASRNWTGSTSSNGGHTHTLTTASAGSHTHTTNNTGGGLPVNIMPLYKTVYMWQRTA